MSDKLSIFEPKPPNGKWLNNKSGKIREGWWTYYWPSDVFYVAIKGLRQQRIHGEEPEYGNWRLVRQSHANSTSSESL